MDVQEAVEAPRIWTEGGSLELELAYSDATADALTKRGHTIQRMKHIAGGMNAIAFSPDGTMTGCRLLARRRHASRHRGRTSPARRQVRDDIE